MIIGENTLGVTYGNTYAQRRGFMLVVTGSNPASCAVKFSIRTAVQFPLSLP